MRVLHVISDSNVGGAGVLLTSLLRHFDPARVQSSVALPIDSALIDRIAPLNVPIRLLHFPTDRPSLQSITELSRLIDADGVDIVHTNAAISARIAGRLLRRRVVYTRHCCFPPTGIWRIGSLRRLGGRWNAALCDRAIATAEAARENLRQSGISDDRISVIVNGSEPIRVLTDTEIMATRKRWQINSDTFVIGICARLEACKGHETLLYAAKRLLSLTDRRLCFLIVGDGSRRPSLEGLAHTLGIAEQVRFTGFLSDVAPAFRLMDLNVNCSLGTETSCLAISEGMSAGVPAIVSDYGGNRAMIGDSEAGIVYPTGDADALADALLSLIRDPERTEQMRRAARQRYEQHFSPLRMTEQLTEVYEQLYATGVKQ